MRSLQSNFNYQLEEITVHEINEIKVSSTKIREAIENGNVDLVLNYSGNYFQFSGNVIKELNVLRR